MSFKKVSHVIFDLDGLILDTERSYEKIMHAMAESHSKEYSPDVKFKLMGTPEIECARIFVEELNIPITVEECLKDYYKRIEEELTNPPFMPGATRLIKHLVTNKIPIAIATSSGRVTYDIKTKNYQDIFQLFNHVVCGTNNPEVPKGKPAPDIFLVCAKYFSDYPDPCNVLVFEDSPNGLRAGLDAGMQVVFVPDHRVGNEDRTLATLTLDSLEQFKPELFGLPSF
ncbi:hypothetical protein ABEB36_008058 [Hypothenemus hampei]|uniref:Uncharacterized protein n=1 Tax=Hypothenemus hampei TaxID=57062 RepID=A0ABD1EKK6_HYPHA